MLTGGNAVLSVVSATDQFYRIMNVMTHSWDRLTDEFGRPEIWMRGPNRRSRSVILALAWLFTRTSRPTPADAAHYIIRVMDTA